MSDSKWKRPEDELPEERTEVLWVHDGYTYKGPVNKYADHETFYGKDFAVERPSDVVDAWRPLPGPPEWVEGSNG